MCIFSKSTGCPLPKTVFFACLMTLLTMSVYMGCGGCVVQWHVQWHVHCTQGRGRQLRLLAPVAPRPRTWHQCSLTPEAGQWWPWSVSAPGRRMSTLSPGHHHVSSVWGPGAWHWHWHRSSRPLLLCLSSVKMWVKSSVVNFKPMMSDVN